MKFNCSYSKLESLHLLQPNPKNPNKHPEKQVDMLAKIIDYQGQRSPIVVSNRSGFITKGHGRLEAIKKLGWEKAAVDYQDYESEAQEFADMIADNKISELAEHDDSIMADALKEIEIDDFDLLGIPDFQINIGIPLQELDDKQSFDDSDKKYIIEAQFPNDMEMMDVHDDLLHRGYIVRVK